LARTGSPVAALAARQRGDRSRNLGVVGWDLRSAHWKGARMRHVAPWPTARTTCAPDACGPDLRQPPYQDGPVTKATQTTGEVKW